MTVDLERVRVGGPADRSNDAVARAFQRIGGSDKIAGGRLIESVELTAGTTNTINHGLGHTPHWLIVGRNKAGDVWQNSRDDKVIELYTMVTMTVDLWVF